jgi:hypothetical protein
MMYLFMSLLCTILFSLHNTAVSFSTVNSLRFPSFQSLSKRNIPVGAVTSDVATERTVFPIELDDNVVLEDTKEWVQRVIADFGVCPFTVDKERAGIPMGGVRYAVSRAETPEEAFIVYWEEVQALLKVPLG